MNNIFYQCLISVNSDVSSKEEAIHYVSEKAYNHNFVVDEKKYEEAVQKREEEISTAVGFGIAIPHGKTSAVTKPFVAFIRPKHSINWGGEDVDLIFMIGVPQQNVGTLHLRIISTISKKLLNDQFREKIRNVKSSEEAYELLVKISEGENDDE